MRGQYYSFLLRTTYSAQEALLDTVEKTWKGCWMAMWQPDPDFVWTGICCDADLRAAIDEYVEESAQGGDNQRIKNAAKMAEMYRTGSSAWQWPMRTESCTRMTRFQISSMTRIDIWDDEEAVRDILRMRAMNDGKSIPRYQL